MRRYELTDEQWAVIEPLLPKAATGRPLMNFIAMIHLAFIERYLRVAFLDRT